MTEIAPDQGMTWIQWVISTVFALFALVYGGAYFKLSGEVDKLKDAKQQDLDRLKDQQNVLGLALRDRGDAADKEIWAAINEMRRLDDGLVTRGELDALRASMDKQRDVTLAAVEKIREMFDADRAARATDRANDAAMRVTKMDLERALDRRFGHATAGNN